MNQLFNFIRRYWIIITVFNFLVITYFSLYPLPQFPNVPGSDKTHHLIAYAGLSFPVCLANRKKWWIFILLFAAYSGLVEVIQPYINRYGEWEDLVANVTGLIIGFSLSRLIRLP